MDNIKTLDSNVISWEDEIYNLVVDEIKPIISTTLQRNIETHKLEETFVYTSNVTGKKKSKNKIKS